MNEKKNSRPSSLSSTYQGYLDTLAKSRIVTSRLLTWVLGPTAWPGDMMADGVNPGMVRGCSFFPGRPPPVVTTTGAWRERTTNIS